ncbi:MAG: RtcB family protein, partial [Spirochaetia bacterium]|nr:RtcB family protein [Spirochaetia bacterium]
MKSADIKQVARRVSDWVWEIPAEFRSDMKVPARIYASEEMLERISKDSSIDQLINVAALPGVQEAVFVMPDAHEGYGFPIGGVAATLYPDGVISPGGIGYDINCGVRLLKSPHQYADIEPRLEEIVQRLYRDIPSGVGKDGFVKMTAKELDQVLQKGARWAVQQGFGQKQDLDFLESRGELAEADPSAVSDHAKQRGKNQVGTIGAGNHFVEVDRIDKIYDEETARTFGLEENQIVVLIHTGSRGLGHQVATDYIKRMMATMAGHGIHVADRELACAPLSSPEGREYFGAMCAAANFAWANRQVITDAVR